MFGHIFEVILWKRNWVRLF